MRFRSFLVTLIPRLCFILVFGSIFDFSHRASRIESSSIGILRAFLLTRLETDVIDVRVLWRFSFTDFNSKHRANEK